MFVPVSRTPFFSDSVSKEGETGPHLEGGFVEGEVNGVGEGKGAAADVVKEVGGKEVEVGMC